MNRKLASLVMMGALMLGSQTLGNSDYREIKKEHNRLKGRKIIPKGCKEYTYTETFGILKVIAHNEKAAYKKYKRWYNENAAIII